MFNGDSLGNMLLNQEAKCLKCGKSIVFEKGVNLARKNGIGDNVVMCSKCRSVWNVYLVPGKMMLTENVTDKYFSRRQESGFDSPKQVQGKTQPGQGKASAFPVESQEKEKTMGKCIKCGKKTKNEYSCRTGSEFLCTKCQKKGDAAGSIFTAILSIAITVLFFLSVAAGNPTATLGIGIAIVIFTVSVNVWAIYTISIILKDKRLKNEGKAEEIINGIINN
jgi:NAD-dependent SIR2 family protein deacetylase